MNLFLTEFDCPDVTLCSWHDVKIQPLTHELTAGSGQRGRCHTTCCSCFSQSTCLLFRARQAQRPRRVETWLLTDHQVWSMKRKSHDSLKRLLNRWGVCVCVFFGGGGLFSVCVCVYFRGIGGLMCVWERGVSTLVYVWSICKRGLQHCPSHTTKRPHSWPTVEDLR